MEFIGGGGGIHSDSSWIHRWICPWNRLESVLVSHMIVGLLTSRLPIHSASELGCIYTQVIRNCNTRFRESRMARVQKQGRDDYLSSYKIPLQGSFPEYAYNEKTYVRGVVYFIILCGHPYFVSCFLGSISNSMKWNSDNFGHDTCKFKTCFSGQLTVNSHSTKRVLHRL